MKKSNIISFFLLLITVSLFFSSFLTFGCSSEVGIKDGMVVKHIYRISMLDEDIPTNFTFTKKSSDIFHVVWEYGGSIDMIGSWDVDVSTSIVSNMLMFGPDVGTHNHAWIWTDVSLNDQVLIFNFFSNSDHLLNITGEAMHGSMEVWQLEDDEGSVVWYEKTQGFLVNGTFRYSSDWQKYTFVSVSVPNPNQGIPGYNYLLILGIITIISIILMKKQKTKI